jgi:tetratricopeptide (TPR) repeat protein
LAAVRQAVEFDPTLELDPVTMVAGMLAELGQQYAYQGAYADALDSLRQAVELDPQIELRYTWGLADAYNELCRQRGSPDLTEMALSACERAVELAIATDDAYLNHEICQNAGIDGLAETFLPACERAVELAIAIDDAYLSYIICLDKSIDSLAGIVWPACEHAQGLAIEIPFRETVKGVVKSGGRYVWIFEGTAGEVITIKMSEDGSMLDTYLTLLGPDGAMLITDDDGGDGSNSMVRGFVLPETGTYTIVAGGSRDSAGAYELTLLDETE